MQTEPLIEDDPGLRKTNTLLRISIDERAELLVQTKEACVFEANSKGSSQDFSSSGGDGDSKNPGSPQSSQSFEGLDLRDSPKDADEYDSSVFVQELDRSTQLVRSKQENHLSFQEQNRPVSTMVRQVTIGSLANQEITELDDI